MNERALDALAVFLSGYAKRYLEPRYDALIATRVGQRLQGSDEVSKHAVEAALYALMAYANDRLAESTPTKRLIKQILLDLPAELGCRIMKPIPEAAAGERDFECAPDAQVTAAIDEILAPSAGFDRAGARRIIDRVVERSVELLHPVPPVARDGQRDPAERMPVSQSGVVAGAIAALERTRASVAQERQRLKRRRLEGP